jgi:hypothetical protein
MEQTYPQVATLDPTAVQAAIEGGERMTAEEAVEYALGHTPALTAARSRP